MIRFCSKALLDLLPFLIGAGNGVINTEDVLWVNRVLNRFLPLNSHLWERPVHKTFAYLTDAVVMADRATTL